MKSTRERSLVLQREVLDLLDKPEKVKVSPSIPAKKCLLVAREYEVEAQRLDQGRGWHRLSAQERRTCQIAFAVDELQSYLRRITGEKLPIEKDKVSGTTCIELLVEGDGADDGFEIQHVIGSDLRLVGNNPRSLLYAIYHFLEAQGCRWYGLERSDQIIPQRKEILIPGSVRQRASFPIRFFHSHLENRASAAMLDWFGKNRLNLWGADNDRPGQRSRGIQLYGGNHWLIHHAEFERNFNYSDDKERRKFLDHVIQLYGKGHYRDVDFVDYIGEDWAKRVDSPGMRKLGSPSDQDVYLLAQIQKTVDESVPERKVGTWGWAYYDTVEPPKNDLPKGFAATMGLWAMSDPRFALDDPASRHNHRWPGRVTETEMEDYHLPSNIQIWEAFCGWPCRMGIGDYFAMARNAFLPAPFVSVLADTLPKLVERKALYFSIMHIANGHWGMMEPFYYLMTRLLWDKDTDVAATLAEMFRHQFGEGAAIAVRCLFAMERAMLPQFWIRGFVAKRLDWLTLHDKQEEFWCWGEYFGREEFLRVGNDLEEARAAVKKLVDTPRARLWEQQIEYAGAMHQVYARAVETYEAARCDEHWHFSKEAAQNFSLAAEALRGLSAVDLPRWSRNVHYYERSVLEQTAIEPALRRMSCNLGIPLPKEAMPFDHGALGVELTYAAKDSKLNLQRTVWTHGQKRSLQVGLGNYQWCQPYVRGNRLFITGQDKESSPARSVLRCLDLENGHILWEHVCEDAGYSALLSTYLGVEPGSVIARECHENPERGSALIRLEIETGRELWRVEDAAEWRFGGNGAALIIDIDGDGKLEVIDSAVAHIACIDLESGRVKWRYDDQIKICHGRTAAADVNGDGQLELVIGGEYNEPGGTSSLQVLRNDGTLLWKSGGHPHDLGSTLSHLCDVDGDGKTEILHASLELIGARRLPTSDLYCWNADGTLRYRAPYGGREVGIADFDGDGRLEAIFITSGRDGGWAAKPAIACLDAATGAERWRKPIERHYLDDDLQVMADFDGDGLPEALLFTAHQSGYGHVPGQPSWGDAYLVKGNGDILWKADVKDLCYAALIGSPQKPEGLIIAGGNGLIWRLK